MRSGFAILLLVLAASAAEAQTAGPVPVASHPAGPDVPAAQAVIRQTCLGCHSDRTRSGNLSLADYDVATAGSRPAVTEKIIRKLRAGQMPPAGARRPEEATLQGVAALLETQADAQAARAESPGRRTFQRLNRSEYARSVKDLLDLDIDAAGYLPLDPKSANFDNIADAQLLSPTLMQAYLSAAAEISRLAVGDPQATAREATYEVSRWTSQREHVDGTPYGTRGGLSVTHAFPADGEYRFRVSFFYETTGALYGNGRAALHTKDAPEQVEISIDGERVALLDVDRWMSSSDPDGLNLRTPPLRVTAGPHRVAAAFIRRLEGPVQDLIAPLDWSIASTSIADAYGFTTLPHLRDMAITGPFDVSGVSETPSRTRIFSCRPASAPQQRQCARQIVSRLGGQAFRRPLSERDVNDLMGLYQQGAASGGFEGGIRMALEGVLASPRFVFRLEERPLQVRPGQTYPLSAYDLASRLSYFLWATAPDQPLLKAAAAGTLATSDGLAREVRRMLADPRAAVLASRFGGQWLRLQDLDKINPDVRVYPNYDDQLKAAMRRETELFFEQLIATDRPVTELFTADYTFVNERLARHYGMTGVVGPDFRRVRYPDLTRRGLFGHGSVLTLTSHADRTSPVLRGKWVMEVLLGTPPPAPPPNIPALEETGDAEDGRLRTVRERMELHRASAACMSCHRMIDPIGLAFEQFDVTGAWRIRDNGMPIDPASALYDGTPIRGVADLRAALLARPATLLQTFTENLMTYALGRRLEPSDMPVVRAVARQAAAADQRFSAFVLAIVNTQAFRAKAADAPVATAPAGSH